MIIIKTQIAGSPAVSILSPRMATAASQASLILYLTFEHHRVGEMLLLRAPTPPFTSTYSLLCPKDSHYTADMPGFKIGILTLTGGWQGTI